MKTILTILLACFLIGTADAQRARISREQWYALLDEDWDHGRRLWREGKITVAQYSQWREDAWNEMVAKYGNPPQRPQRAYVKSPEEIELERLNRQIWQMRQEMQQQGYR